MMFSKQPGPDSNEITDLQSTTGRHHFIFASTALAGIFVTYLVVNALSANDQGKGQWSGAALENVVADSAGVDTSPGNIVLAMLDPNAGSQFQYQSATDTFPDLDNFPDLDKRPEPESFSETITPPEESDTQFVEETPIEEDTTPQLSDYILEQDWTVAKVRRGDTLSQLFDRHDLGTGEAYAVAALEGASVLKRIRPGEQLKLKKNENGTLGLLNYPINEFESLMVFGAAHDYHTAMELREPEIRINNARAVINSSLLGAASKAGVSINTMYEFIAMFGWQVDFSMDLQKGDQFSVIYEELYLEDKKVGNGEIIAAELIVSGNRLQAVRHVDEEGFSNYYAPNGDGIEGTFLRSPLKFGHITSNFSKSRLHPIKKVWRAHKGVDYGAPRGTPVMATGDGTVKIARRDRGYGKVIILRHGGTYQTLYAHLNGYADGIKSGARVKQGDVIGYVGSTGLATGPHLHYEFRVHGVHKNPVTVEFPTSAPIEERYLTSFMRSASIWVDELEYLGSVPVAQLISAH